MSVLYLLVPVALVVVCAAVAAYLWAARRGQFDDLVTPAWRMLEEDERPSPVGLDPAAAGSEPTGEPPPDAPDQGRGAVPEIART